VLIGGSAAGLLLINGRIAGISGLLAGAISPKPQAFQWAFLLGLLAAGAIAGLAGRTASVALTAQTLPTLAAAGLLVGFGARLGGGCTSGHGVCGLANLSPRSLVATATFMMTAALTVFVTRHLTGAHGALTLAGL
jgi:uncharacterized membrane protein YedE/YeeE